MLFREIISVYCENHTEHINTLNISDTLLFNQRYAGSEMKSEDVILCCLVRAIAHLKGAVIDGYGAMME
jgi:hypothetical protein